ncbi:MAG: PIN domain-containing protein [Thermoleophilia bacterium]
MVAPAEFAASAGGSEPAREFLLDSVILIDHLNGIPQATEFLRAARSLSAISVITRAEVLCGFTQDEEDLGMAFLDLFPTLPLDCDAADMAGRLRRTWRWKMPDAVQAALAITHGLRLVTRNTKDFPPERHAFVFVPYELEP